MDCAKQKASSATGSKEIMDKVQTSGYNSSAAEPSREISSEQKFFYRQKSKQWIRAASETSDEFDGGRISTGDVSLSSKELAGLTASANLDDGRWSIIPKFESEEIILGRFLGNGAYGIVYEVVGFTNLAKIENQKSRLQIKRNHLNEEEEPKYALKKIRGKLSASQTNDAITDLAIEARILSCITHRNIVKIYATARGDPLSSKFFIIMERLRGTLEDRLVGWGARLTQTVGSCFCLGGSKNRVMGDIWSERFGVASDLASAIRYLHEHYIIYRDIKPENMGFDVQGNLKLFDFGLAKPLHDEKKNELGLYKLTSNVGSRRYMAPEVALGKPYDMTLDVYSFAILFWQVCALETPFSDLTELDTHLKEVAKGGRRPVINKKWPRSWGVFLNKCWNGE